MCLNERKHRTRDTQRERCIHTAWRRVLTYRVLAPVHRRTAPLAPEWRCTRAEPRATRGPTTSSARSRAPRRERVRAGRGAREAPDSTRDTDVTHTSQPAAPRHTAQARRTPARRYGRYGSPTRRRQAARQPPPPPPRTSVPTPMPPVAPPHTRLRLPHGASPTHTPRTYWAAPRLPWACPGEGGAATRQQARARPSGGRALSRLGRPRHPSGCRWPAASRGTVARACSSLPASGAS